MSVFTITPRRLAGSLIALAFLAGCSDTQPTAPQPSDARAGDGFVVPDQIPVEIDAVFSGPPNRDPGEISLDDPSVFVQIHDIEEYLGRPASADDVRIGDDWETGTSAENFEILDLDDDGDLDIQLRFSTQELIDDGHLGPNTTEITVWGMDQGSGDLYMGTATVEIIQPEIRTLSTGEPNNTSGGVFFDLTPELDVAVVSFDVAYTGTVGTMVEVQVWTRPGSYVGHDDSPDGWTLTQTVEGERLGTTVLSPLVLDIPIELSEGETTGIYLQAITPGGGIRYNGTAANPPQTTWSNDDLTLFGDVARVGTEPFGGTRFTPRTFAGNVNYMVN